MTKRSAGLILYRIAQGELLVLLVHPGGPYWSRKDRGSWSIPKGEIGPDEDPAAAALREFEEELGARPEGPLQALGEIVQAGGKRVTAFAMAGDLDVGAIRSNVFALEWPPKSGRVQEFPEIDRAGWFSLALAREKVLPSQAPLLDRLAALVADLP